LRVLVDTSVLMRSAELGRDLISLVEDKLGEAVEPILLEGVLWGLGLNESRGGRVGASARVARRIAEGMAIMEGQSGRGVDEELLAKGRETGYLVVTTGKELLTRLRKSGCKAIYVARTSEVWLFV